MKNTKENIIYNINNILLSGYNDNKYLTSILQEENKNLKDIDSELKQDFNNIQNGNRIELPEECKKEFVDALLYLKGGKFPQAYTAFSALRKISEKPDEVCKSMALCLLNMKAYNIILKYYEPMLKEKTDDIEAQNILAGAYFGTPKYYKKAIDIYEKLIKENDGDDIHDYNYKLAFLYERVYQNKYLDTQIKYAEEALKYTQNENFIKIFLAKLNYRKGNKEKSQKYFEEVLKNNPTPEEKVAYSRFLMKEGKIKEAYDLYRVRFSTGNVNYPKVLEDEKRWDGKTDISKSTVIVHYEQGFGDSVMFSRYIPYLSKLAKKVIFVVQKNLIPVFKDSGFDKYCTILSHEADINPNIELENTNSSVMYSKGQGMARIPHDYHIPLLDLPYLFDESPEKMRDAKGYLSIDKDKVEKYKKKYISKNKKIKIGLAYHGTKESILTYRDIPIKALLPLLKLKNVEFYSLQCDEFKKELKKYKNIKVKDLSDTLKTFEDTACAMNCMDIIISSDNVIMNLAGALGIKTYCLFNVFTESRWYKTTGNNIGWYKSVKPFQAKNFNEWDKVVSEIINSLKKEFKI